MVTSPSGSIHWALGQVQTLKKISGTKMVPLGHRFSTVFSLSEVSQIANFHELHLAKWHTSALSQVISSTYPDVIDIYMGFWSVKLAASSKLSLKQ